jgi:hypothetical protein
MASIAVVTYSLEIAFASALRFLIEGLRDVCDAFLRHL